MKLKWVLILTEIMDTIMLIQMIIKMNVMKVIEDLMHFLSLKR